MKKILLFLILLCIEKSLHAQYIYTIKADSVKITNTCDTAELIIENHTQNVPGFLFNKGRGRTEFRRIAQLDDTSVVIGGDTIHLGRGSNNFANADLNFDGDHYHNGAFHKVNLYDFGEIGFKSNNAGYTTSADLKLNPVQGYSLSVKDNSNADPNRNFTASQTMGRRAIALAINGKQNGLSENSELRIVKDGWFISGDAINYETGETYYGSIGYGVPTSTLKGGVRINTENAPIRIDTRGSDGFVDRYIDINLHNADSLTFATLTHSNDITRFSQTRTGFTFARYDGINDFRVLRLPASTSITDSILVIDDNGQVKKRSQSSFRKSVTVTASSYTVPADVDVVFINYTGGIATISLPASIIDREITIKNMNTTNSVALSGLDASESNTIATRGAITIKYTGSTWVGISKY
jgi:hypothetical protein